MDPKTKKPLMKPEFCANALKEAWEPKFKDVEVDEETMDLFIDQFACNLGDNDFDIDKKRVRPGDVVMVLTFSLKRLVCPCEVGASLLSISC